MPPIEEGVVARRGHGDQVAEEEDKVVVLPAEDGEQVEVGQEVDHVEGQPADAKDQHHGDEHSVGTKISRPLGLFSFCRTKSRPLLGSLLQLADDGRVAEDDGAEGQHELHDASEGTVDCALHAGPGLCARLDAVGAFQGVHVEGVGGGEEAGRQVDEDDQEDASLHLSGGEI